MPDTMAAYLSERKSYCHPMSTPAERLEGHQRAGGLARQAQWRERKLAEVELADAVTDLIEPLQRENIGPEFLRMALKLANDAIRAEVPVSTSLERKQTAEAAKILHTMARLELGESTANTVTFNATDYAARKAELDARMAALASEHGDETAVGT